MIMCLFKWVHLDVLSANLCSFVALQSHADVKVTVTESKAIFGRSKQAKLGFFCGNMDVLKRKPKQGTSVF